MNELDVFLMSSTYILELDKKMLFSHLSSQEILNRHETLIRCQLNKELK